MQPAHRPPADSRQGSPSGAPARETVRDAASVQCAAVAAQQVALLEEEAKLAAQRTALERHEEQLAAYFEAQRRELEQRGQETSAKQLRFQTAYELGRCRLREAWQRLRQEQFRWKHRRGLERAVLKGQRRDLDAAQRQALAAQRDFAQEKQAWEAAKVNLEVEVNGLEARAQNQRAKILEQQAAINRLEEQIRARREQITGAPEASTDLLALTTTPARDTSGEVWLGLSAVTLLPAQFDLPAAPAPRPPLHDLHRLAGDLADQRLQLIEHWHRLGALQECWEGERREIVLELEELAARLVAKGRLLSQREEAALETDQGLRQRHDALVQMRLELIARQAQLRVREVAWDVDRERLLVDVRAREDRAEQHWNALVVLRQRWLKRRRHELAAWRAERQLVEAAHHAQMERAPTAQATSAGPLVQGMEERLAALAQRADAVVQAEADLIEKQIAWEHKQTLAIGRQARLESELQRAEGQRKLAEQQVARLQEELERIARALIDQPDPPISEGLTQAA